MKKILSSFLVSVGFLGSVSATESAPFQLQALDGRFLKYDTVHNLVRLDGGSDLDFSTLDNSLVYSSSNGFVALKNSATGAYFKRVGSFIQTGPFSKTADAAWQFHKLDDGNCILFNGAGSVLGYEKDTDSVLLVSQTDSRRQKLICPLLDTGIQTISLQPEQQIIRGLLYDLLNVPENYTISFDINLETVPTGWASILHYTSDGQSCCKPGQRMPAIWIVPGSTFLHVRFGSTDQGNWGIDTNIGLPLNQYSSVLINAFGNRVQVSIDGIIQDAVMTSSRVFGPALFYLASPFNKPADALIKNYKMVPSTGLLGKSLVNERQLSRGWLYDLVNVPENYTISFVVQLLSRNPGWTSILHYTSDGQSCCSPGQRMPAVYVIPNSSNLYVRFGSVDEGNWGIETNTGLPLNQYSSVVINTFGNRVQVSIDGIIQDAVMTSNRVFGPALFYLASPFNKPADATIKNYKMVPSTGLLAKSLTNERQLTRGWFYDTVNVPENYTISLDIKVQSVQSSWTSILHYTNDGQSCCKPGERMPAVWLIPNSSKLYIAFGSADDGTWGITSTSSLPLNQYSTVLINAFGNKVQVSIDGVIQDAVMTSSRVSGLAQFYLSSPFNKPADALIKNYKMADSMGLLGDSLLNERQLSRGWLYNVVDVPENYTISFDIKVLSISVASTSLFHYTSDGQTCCDPEQRMPAVWLMANSSRLTLRMGPLSDGLWGFNTDIGLPLNEYVTVIINTFGKFAQVSINGTIENVLMPSGRFYGPARFYMGGLSGSPADALIKNYSIVKSTRMLVPKIESLGSSLTEFMEKNQANASSTPMTSEFANYLASKGLFIRNLPTGDIYKYELLKLRPFAFADYVASGYPPVINVNDSDWFSSTALGSQVAPNSHNSTLLVLYHPVSSDNVMNLAEVYFYDVLGSRVVISADDILASESCQKISNLIDDDLSTLWQSTCSTGSNQHQWLKINITNYPIITRVVFANNQDCCQSRMDGTVFSFIQGASNTSLIFTPVLNRSIYEIELNRINGGILWNYQSDQQTTLDYSTINKVYNNSIPNGLALNPGDRLQASDTKSYLSIGSSGETIRLFGSQIGRRVLASACGKIGSFSLDQNGNFALACTSGSYQVIKLAGASQGSYILNLTIETNLTVVDSSGKIYFDAGVSTTQRPSGKYQAIVPDERELVDKLKSYYLIDSTERRYTAETEADVRHADYMAGVLLSFSGGKDIITDSIGKDDKTFNEKEFIEALSRFYGNATQPNATNYIINFSGAFRQENSDVTDCGIQWIYKNGFYFIGAAGNSGQPRNKYNPYMLRVGGAYFNLQSATPNIGTVWEKSNYGAAINVWTTVAMAFRSIQGTSVSAAAVSRSVGAVITAQKSLVRNPSLGIPAYFKFKTYSKMDPADIKYQASPNALGRVDSQLNAAINLTLVTPMNPTADFCTPLGLDPVVPDWNALIQKANTSIIGDFVALPSIARIGRNLFSR